MKPPVAIVALLLASLLGTAAASAQAPQPGADGLLADPALASARPRIERAVSAAVNEGLPSDWLLDKVAEGLSKRVPAPRIAAAVEGLLTRMRDAERIVRDVRSSGPAARRPLLRAAVDALMAGAPAEALAALVSEIAASRPAGTAGASSSAAQALVTVSELAEREFDGAASVEATRDAWRTGRGAGMSRLLQSARRIRGAAGDARDGALREAARARDPVGVDRGAHRGDSFGRGASSGRGPDRR